MSSATFDVSRVRRCPSVTIEYHETMYLRQLQSKYLRDMSPFLQRHAAQAPPAVAELFRRSSLVWLGGGVHANTVDELVGLADRYL